MAIDIKGPAILGYGSDRLPLSDSFGRQERGWLAGDKTNPLSYPKYFVVVAESEHSKSVGQPADGNRVDARLLAPQVVESLDAALLTLAGWRFETAFLGYRKMLESN